MYMSIESIVLPRRITSFPMLFILVGKCPPLIHPRWKIMFFFSRIEFIPLLRFFIYISICIYICAPIRETEGNNNELSCSSRRCPYMQAELLCISRRVFLLLLLSGRSRYLQEIFLEYISSDLFSSSLSRICGRCF